LQKRFDRGRVVYVIDRNGRVRYRQKGIPDNEQLLDLLARMQEE